MLNMPRGVCYKNNHSSIYCFSNDLKETLVFKAASHKVDLPPEVVFKMGDRRELACSMRSCPGELTFVWASLEDKPLFVDVENKPTESVLIFENVTKNHENTVLCKATCGKETKQAKTTIKVYCKCSMTASSEGTSSRWPTGASCHICQSNRFTVTLYVFLQLFIEIY